MKITNIISHVLVDPEYDRDATSSSQDDIVVEIETDEGFVGIGETDLNAWVARALLEAPGTHTMDRGLRETLIGKDPRDPVAIWDELYVATAMTGRRGAGIHALGAVDIALWDIVGQVRGVPTWKALGGDGSASLVPYASLMPHVAEFDRYVEEMVRMVRRSRELGFRAAKLEIIFDGPFAHLNMREPDSRATEVIAEVRRAVGSEFTLMVDVGYAFDTVERAARVLESWAEFDLFFVETPLWADDLDGYAALVARAPMKIAAGEWLATRFEFEELIRRGMVEVVQPDVGRVGGLTEARRVCDMAAAHGRLVVPHAWKTGISVAATAHLAAGTGTCPFFEFLPAELSESALRRELVVEELQLEDGRIVLPQRPGLGIELRRDALERFEQAAAALAGG